MLKEQNSLKIFLIVFSIFLFAKNCFSSSRELSPYYNKYVKERCGKEMKKNCPDVAKNERKKCFNEKNNLFSNECKIFFDRKNKTLKEKLSPENEYLLQTIFLAFCQNEVINICKVKIKDGNLKLKSPLSCVEKMAKKESSLSKTCSNQLKVFIQQLSTINSNNLNEQNNVVNKQNNAVIEQNVNNVVKTNKQQAINASINKVINEQDALADQQDEEEDEKNYIYLSDTYKVKMKDLMSFRKEHKKQLDQMMPNDAREFEYLYLLNKGLLVQGIRIK